MVQPYLNALKALVASELAGIPGLSCRHFFSAAALYANKKLCASLTPAAIAFKLPEQRCSDLIESGQALPLRYFDNSSAKRGDVLFPSPSSLGEAATSGHLKECWAYAHSADA